MGDNQGKGIKKLVTLKIRLLIKILIILLICIVIVVYAVKKEDISGDRSVTYAAREHADVMNSSQIIRSDSSDGTGGTYDVDLGETAQSIIDEVNGYEDTSNVLERYLGTDEEKQKEFLAKLIKAEYITQYPDLRVKDEIGTEIEDPNEFQGCIQVKRASSQTEGSTGSAEDQLLEYMAYDKFMALVDSNSMDALNYFTLQGTLKTEEIEEGQVPEDTEPEEEIELIVATYNQEDINITTNDVEMSFEEDFEDDFEEKDNNNGTKTATSSTLTIDTVAPFAYQDITDNYTMTFDMLWALLVMGEDLDFVSDLAELALQSKIIITVQDNLNISTDTKKYTYQKQIDENVDITIAVENNVAKNSNSNFAKDTIILPSKEENFYKTTVITNTINTAVIDITYADTWILEYFNSYDNKINEAKEIFNQTYTKEDKEELEDTETKVEEAYHSTSYSQEELNAIVEPFENAGAKNTEGKTIPQWKENFKSENAGNVTRDQVISKINSLLSSDDYKSINDLVKKHSSVKSQLVDTSMYTESEYISQRDVCANSLRRLGGGDAVVTQAKNIMDIAHNYYITEKGEPPTIITTHVKTTKIDKVINKQEQENIVVSYNTYTRGTPEVREKINTYSCYSTIGLDWTKHFENSSLLYYMNGESEYNEHVAKYVTQDKKYYICYGEADNETYNYAYGLMFKNGSTWQEEQIISLYKGIFGLQDTTAVSYEETILPYFTENESQYAVKNKSQLEVEIVDNAILEIYSMKRSKIISYIENAQEEYGGRGIEEFTNAQIDVLTDRAYQSWSNRETAVKEIYKIVMNVNNGEDGYSIDDCESLIRFTTDKYKRRDDSRWETFITGEYTICNADGTIAKVLNKDEYDEQGDIEKDYNFIILMNEHEPAKRSIISGAQILFDSLEDSPTGAEQIDTLKWLLYELTNDSRYKIEDINWERLMQKSYNYTRAIGSPIEAFIKAWENYELWKYESGETSVVPSKYVQREDTVEYYKVYNNSGNKISYNVTIEDKVEGDLIEQSEGEELFDEILEIYKLYVDTYIEEKNLELTRKQRNVLVAITYQYGLNYLEENEFAEKYTDNPDNINTTFAAFKGTNDRNNANYIAFAEDKLTDPEGNLIKIGPASILEAAANIHAQMQGYDYCVYKPTDGCNHAGGHICGLPATFEESYLVGPKNSCCATFVSWVLIEAGYEDIINQVENINSAPGLYGDLLKTGEFIEITNFSEVEPGDILVMNTVSDNTGLYDHVQIYAGKADGGNSYHYNAGSRDAMQVAVNIQSDSYVSSVFVCALRYN